MQEEVLSMSDDTDIEVLSTAWAAPLGLGPVSYGVTVNGGVPTLGAVLPQFDEVAFAAGPAVAARPAVQAVRTEASQESVREIPLEIEVVIGRTKVSVAKLMAANEGDRFRLDRNFGEPVELQVNGKVFGYGEIVADDHENIIGIRISSIEKNI